MNNKSKEILVILQEEAAEVIVEVSKCFRFGPDQVLQGTSDSNVKRLEKEIGDLQAMIDLLLEQNIGITQEGIQSAKEHKFSKLRKFSSIFDAK